MKFKWEKCCKQNWTITEWNLICYGSDKVKLCLGPYLSLESILPNYDLFVFPTFVAWVFVAWDNIVCTIKWPTLIAKNGKKNLRFTKKNLIGMTPGYGISS